MSWNPVLDKFIEIKYEHISKFGVASFDYSSGYTDESESCIERWVNRLIQTYPDNKQYQEYVDLIEPLEINQYGTLILARYGRYSNIYNGEEEASGEGFWDKYDGFYRECRSVVIDIDRGQIVCTTMKKFFNINEIEETQLDKIQQRIEKAKTIEFSNKLDGSMQSARWYEDEVVMAGSQALDPNNSWRLEDGYRMLNSNPNYINMLQDYPDYTFIFEYISLKDAHVVKYTKEQEGLYLIGVRSVIDGEEWNYKDIIAIANEYHILTTELFDKTLDTVMNELDDKKSSEAEGFVINIDGYRVKLKYNDFCYIHRALSKLSSPNLIIRSIADNSFDDFIAKVPMAYKNRCIDIANIVYKYIELVELKNKQYMKDSPLATKDCMVYISENVPKYLQSYCRNIFFNKSNNYLKTMGISPHYKKMKEIEKIYEELCRLN